MRDEVVRFGIVVEGQGEVAALPRLIVRIRNELLGVFALQTTPPIRIPKSKLVRDGELERAIRLAQINNHFSGPILVVLDADDDCPAILDPNLRSRALKVVEPQSLSIVIPKYEFETWFLAAAKSLAGSRGLREDLISPPDPEAIRGAKEWLSENMIPGRKYSPSVNQAALVAGMDLAAARTCESFDRLCREIERLVTM